MIHILGGNWQEANGYAKFKDLSPRDIVYIDSERRLLGLTPTVIVCVGTYRSIPGYHMFVELCKERSTNSQHYVIHWRPYG